MRKILFPMLALGLLSACGSTPRPEPSAELAVVEDSFLPIPARSDLTTPGRQALIGPLDTIGIDVYGVEELSMQFQVDASGTVGGPRVAAGCLPRGRRGPGARGRLARAPGLRQYCE